MRCALLFFVSSVFCFSSTAQKSLSSSPKTSAYTYIYKINKKEAYALYRSGMYKANESYLHSLVDSFETYDDPPELSVGDYLFTYAKDNHLIFELHPVGDVEYKLIDNNRDLVVALHTKTGRLIEDAEVYIRNRKLAYDKNIHSYRLSKYKKSGLIRVYKDDLVYFFPITKNKYKRPFQLQYKVPFKYVIKPFRKLFNKRNYSRSYYYRQTPYEEKFRGFMVFNKPKYKPGDTVYLKAFVETKHGRLLKEDLFLRLTGSGFTTDTIIARLHPYGNGGYEYKFVLTDSLDIGLDKEYLLTLEELRSKKYNLDEYYGNLDDEEYALKRKVVMRGKFYFEDYELSTISFFARTDKDEHRRNETAAIYVKATDENDMAVMDGRVQILVKASFGSDRKFHAPKVFLPDTVWYHEQTLDQIGETKVMLPDSIFPKVSFSYEVECNFLNGNNELQTQTLYGRFIDEEESILFTPVNDSLRIEQIVNGQSKIATSSLYVFGDDDYEDTLEQKTVMLPATIRINPFARIYEVETENLDEEFEIKPNKGMVSCLALRTKDSVTIQLSNPYHLQVWYSLFAGNKIIDHGVTDNLLFKDKVRTKKNYFVSLQYIWGNSVLNEDYTIPYQDKLLTIKVNQPQFIYPGQTAQIDIDVRNAWGKPVADADITAYSFTKKFKNAKTPFVPYLGKIYPGRKRYGNFNPDEDEDYDAEGSIKLNWQRWSREMKLDSIEYFRLLHPENFYINTEPVKDSITQIAPFIVIKGDIQPIHQIYVDERPVFFSQANNSSDIASAFLRDFTHSGFVLPKA